MYDSLVLSGGGPKGVVMLGLLHFYYVNNLISNESIIESAGTSIGAAIILLLACGYTPMEIFNEIYAKDNMFDMKNAGIWDIINGMGLMSINGFAERIEEMVTRKLKCSPSLGRLKKLTGKTIHISSSNASQGYEEHYSHHTHPRLGSVNAVKMSCNLFPLFQKIHYRGDAIVDGGYTNNVPWDYISEGKNTLCLVVKGNDFEFMSENTFVGYAMKVFMMSINAASDLRCSIAPPNITIVKAFWEHSSILQLNMTSDEKMKMFLKGYQSAERESKTEYLNVVGWDYRKAGFLEEKDSEEDLSEWLEWEWGQDP